MTKYEASILGHGLAINLNIQKILVIRDSNLSIYQL